MTELRDRFVRTITEVRIDLHRFDIRKRPLVTLSAAISCLVWLFRSMTVPSPHFEDESPDPQPGGLLGELESRQDDVLDQLDALDEKLNEVLKGLEVGEQTTFDSLSPPQGPSNAAAFGAERLVSGEDETIDHGESEQKGDDLDSDAFGPADDWA